MDVSPEFKDTTKIILAQRVNYHCSKCYVSTAGPNEDPNKSTITGEAGHILGAKPTSARYDPEMSNEERRDISNGIWLCTPCHKKLDRDWKKFDAKTIRGFKLEAEAKWELKQDRNSTDQIEGSVLGSVTTKWCHETTNDDRYVIRRSVLRTANAWFNDNSIRTISITGMGGAGKTSFVGDWLKARNDNLFRNVKGLFYWSFYVEKSVDNFLISLMKYLEEIERIDFAYGRKESIQAFTEKLSSCPPILLVLDGLEVLQHAMSEGKSYGQFLDAKLREFILLVTYTRKPWLCVITSRFPISDLKTVQQAKSIVLGELESREAEELLFAYGVFGVEKDRLTIANFLEGHPLTLRLFAVSLPREYIHKPKLHLRNIFGEGLSYNSFKDKLDRMLEFYSRSLSDIQRGIVSSLSFFKSPVPDLTVNTLLISVLNANSDEEGMLPISTVQRELLRLSSSGLVIKDEIGGKTLYACHPIIRDYFRAQLFRQDKKGSVSAINMLTDKPDSMSFYGVTNLEPLIVGIESLLEMGLVGKALELFVNRLEKGKVFLQEGLPKEGKRIFDAFILDEESRSSSLDFFERLQMSNYRGLDNIAFLVGASQFGIDLGEYEDAEKSCKLAINKSTGSRQTDSLRNLSKIAFCRGDFRGAVEHASLALKMAKAGSKSEVQLYKQALALYYLARSYASVGEFKQVKVALMELEELNIIFESSDLRVLPCAVRLWLGVCGDNKDFLLKDAKLCQKEVAGLSVDSFSAEIKLLIAHAYLLSGKVSKSLPLIEEVYSDSVKNSYPHQMCQAMILKEYSKLAGDVESSVKRFSEIIAMATGGEMLGLKVSALWCQSLICNTSGGAELVAEAEELADLCGYVPFKNMYK